VPGEGRSGLPLLGLMNAIRVPSGRIMAATRSRLPVAARGLADAADAKGRSDGSTGNGRIAYELITWFHPRSETQSFGSPLPMLAQYDM